MRRFVGPGLEETAPPSELMTSARLTAQVVTGVSAITRPLPPLPRRIADSPKQAPRSSRTTDPSPSEASAQPSAIT